VVLLWCGGTDRSRETAKKGVIVVFQLKPLILTKLKCGCTQVLVL
jgi:hypothetical protein